MGDASCSCDSDTSTSCIHEEEAREYMSFFLDSDDDSDADGPRSKRRRKSSSPKPKPPKKTVKRAQYDGDSCDERDNECEMLGFSQTGNTVKTKRFHWTIQGFPGCDIVENERGSLRSDRYYVAGENNQLQFYFLIEALKTDDDTYFGVYLCVLGAHTEVSVTTKCSIINYKNHPLTLSSVKGVRFPRKTGCRYLGCISKAEYIEDDYEQCVYMPDGDFTLDFRVWGNFKTPQPTLQERNKFAKDGQVRDVILKVDDKKFTASKKLLMEQSSVFAKMLEKTKKNEQVKITDIKPDVMKQLLIYVNTGRVTKLFKYTKELSAAADKYKLKNLKAICRSVIEETT